MEIQMWREILNPYELAVKELTTKFEHLIKEHHAKGFYSSIELVQGRVKTISSILDKCQKKGISIDDVTTKIEDIAGIRIICQFVEDIERVVKRSQDIWSEYTANGWDIKASCEECTGIDVRYYKTTGTIV